MMLNFLMPVTIMIAYSVMLVLVGLPLSLACLPRQQRWLALPLAPLVAMALVSCVYEYFFFLLFQPYRPFFVHSVVIAVSLAALVIAALKLRGERLWTAIKDILRGLIRVLPLMVVPLLAIVIVGGFFVVNGLEMLSAGEDEFAYVEVARQVMEHLFTRDSLDFPWPRADHYLSDLVAHQGAYSPGWRLGAFFLLADMSRIFNISLEKSFPLLTGVGIFVGTASLALLELFVGRSRLVVVAAQVMFVTSWLLVMLHFQGSLSSVTTMGIRLGGLGFILWSVVGTRKIAPLILAGVLGAGWLVLYYESIGSGLVLPLLACMAVALFQTVYRRSAEPIQLVVRSAAVFLLAYALQPELFKIALRLHESLILGLSAGPKNLRFADVDYVAAVRMANTVAASFFPPILGYYSLYDDNAVNHHLYNAMNSFSLIILLSISGIAALGFWRRLPGCAGVAWAAIPWALFGITFLMASSGSTSFAIRGAQYLMPHIFIGLSLFVFARCSKFDTKNWALLSTVIPLAGRIGVGILWVAIVGLNGFAVARTIDHVNRFNEATDVEVKHFNPDSQRWHLFRKLVTQTDGAPVLLSGFRDTPRTHMIALGLRLVPTLLGQTVTNYWTSADPNVAVPHYFQQFRHWLSSDELLKRFNTDPLWNWSLTYTSLLARTEQAIIPVSGSYPLEWGSWPSLFGPVGWRVPNLCDVLSRRERAFNVESEPTAAGQDDFGSFWRLDRTVTVRPVEPIDAAALFEVRYTGVAPKILLDGAEVKGRVRAGLGGKSMILEFDARQHGNNSIEVSAPAETRVRTIGLYRLLL
jgi:hypothetical protein